MANLEARNHVERVLSVAHNEAAVVGEPGIANSWRRCLVDHKLDPARRGPPRTLTQSELKQHAEPIDGADPPRHIRAGRPLPRPAQHRLLRQPRRYQCGDPVQPPARRRGRHHPAPVEGLYRFDLRRGHRRHQRSGHRARRATSDPGASRRAFSRTMVDVHLRGGAAVRPCRAVGRRGQHHLMPRRSRSRRASDRARRHRADGAADRGSDFPLALPPRLDRQTARRRCRRQRHDRLRRRPAHARRQPRRAPGLRPVGCDDRRGNAAVAIHPA